MQILLLTMITALLVTLIFNLRGHLFLGDSGSYFLSFTLALLVIYVYDVAVNRLPADLIILWFLIPVTDCLRVMIVRIAHGQSPFTSDRRHLHHYLYRRMPWRWGLLIYLGVAGLPGFLASFAPNTAPLWAVAAICGYGLIITWPYRSINISDA